MKINLGGITFGGNKNHWYDGSVPFDDFIGNNGDPVDSTKWDTSIDTGGSITIQGNKCLIYARASSAYTVTPCDVTLTLKTALTSGRIIAMFSSIYFEEVGTQMCYFYMYVGNDTDGWTTITTITCDGHDDELIGRSDNSICTSLECIYKGNNLWNVYYGNNLISENLSKPNGLQIKFYAHTQENNIIAGQDGIFYGYIDSVIKG